MFVYDLGVAWVFPAFASHYTLPPLIYKGAVAVKRLP